MDGQLFQGLIAGASSTAVIATVVGGVFALITKRTRTPELRLAEAQFSVKVYQDQLVEARADKELNDKTITTLREYVSKVEQDGREDQAIIRDLYEQIRLIEARNGEKDAKIRALQALIDNVADKVSRGQVITLADLGRTYTEADQEAADDAHL